MTSCLEILLTPCIHRGLIGLGGERVNVPVVSFVNAISIMTCFSCGLMFA